MKTTVEIPDDLLRQAKISAAIRGETLRQLITEALREHLRLLGGGAEPPRGWRAVFGRVSPSDTAEIDEIVQEDLGGIDPEDWR